MRPHHLYGPGVPIEAGHNGVLAFGLLHLLFWLLLILVIVWAVRHYTAHMPRPQSPLELAKARYAKGEITKAEFEDIKKAVA